MIGADDRGAADGFAWGAGAPCALQSPLTLVTTFGALPGPWDVTSVRRVQVRPPSLTLTPSP